MVNENKTLNEQEIKVNTEWDALAKMIFERVMDYDEMSEEKKKIFRQHLDQENWKEFFNFKFENVEGKGWVITYDPHSYFNNMLYKFQQVLDFNTSDWNRENKKLTQEIENYRLEIEALKTEIEVHLEAIETGGKERWTQKEALTKDLADSLETLRVEREALSGERERNRELQKKLEDSLEMLEEVRGNLRGERKKNQELMWLLNLFTKPLPKNKLKILKEKAKTKFQHLVEKTKQRGQEFIAKIEVKVK